MRFAFVRIKVEPGRLEEVAAAVMEIDGVSEVHSVTGPFDLLVKLYAPGYDDFGDIIPDRLGRIPGIRDSETMLAFRAFKAVG